MKNHDLYLKFAFITAVSFKKSRMLAACTAKRSMSISKVTFTRYSSLININYKDIEIAYKEFAL
jgi:hypothetical protein